MNVIELCQTTASIQLSNDELALLNNALNEICHGIDLAGEFSTRIGCEKQEAEQLLQQIHRLMEDMKKK